MLTVTLQVCLYSTPDSNQDYTGFKSDASANWANGAFCTGRESRTPKILILSQARLPVPPFPHFNLSSKKLVWEAGLEPAPSCIQSRLTTNCYIPSFAVLTGFEPATFRETVGCTSRCATVLFCGEQRNRTFITLQWTCLAGKRNKPIFTYFPILRRVWESNPHESLTPNSFQDCGHHLLAWPSFGF